MPKAARNSVFDAANSPRAWLQKLLNFSGEATRIGEGKRSVFDAVNPQAWSQKLVNFSSEQTTLKFFCSVIAAVIIN